MAHLDFVKYQSSILQSILKKRNLKKKLQDLMATNPIKTSLTELVRIELEIFQFKM